MITKHTVLLAALVPALALLAACNRPSTEETVPATTDTAAAPAPAATDTMPAEPMPGESTTAPMPADAAPMTTQPTGPAMSFASMDANKDGALTIEEVPATDMLHDHFSVADADGNGQLSEEEVNKHRADMAAAPTK